MLTFEAISRILVRLTYLFFVVDIQYKFFFTEIKYMGKIIF